MKLMKKIKIKARVFALSPIIGCLSIVNAFIRRIVGYPDTGRTPTLYKTTVHLENEICKKWLRKHFTEIISKYKNESIDALSNNLNKHYPAYIWVCWLQGIDEKTPNTVRICIDSIYKNSNGHEVKIVTRENINKYIIIPDIIWDKHNEGMITYAFLSDIIRVMLLRKYGGLWLDATYYLYKPIDNEMFNYSFYSISFEKDRYKWTANQGKWTCNMMAFSPNDTLICYIHDMLLAYVISQNVYITYLVFECIIAIAYEDFEWAQKEIELIPENNIDSQFLYLDNMRNLPVNEDKFQQIIQRTNMFKCPYKMQYNIYTDETKSHLTYYGRLVQENIETDMIGKDNYAG